ncbi:hypothetical protein OHA84_38665 [Streptomyces sp. NBC_00513]|uniref:hypothetical protein n=1 Tax=unclassified Streptomyces TaxID=2593676 RepID=UPI00225AC7C8|nr:hypothetical protein [Streptomyces sp. NBC_00424]MCX5079372.1 hypothetical protein [Streptomyces sp. NBC_00424]MCX5079382.1 hypothetical protein [Streptomyces sp. NBC_00424]WUD46454.1 hypothetical protein OHA84_38715 [Streptomyces sp. NBC_00513]WUD46464.1 hypothetical protein OHA84_38665 [Streptomyces sp. NBC_00513]
MLRVLLVDVVGDGLVLLDVRHRVDVRLASMTYRSTAAGLVRLVLVLDAGLAVTVTARWVRSSRHSDGYGAGMSDDVVVRRVGPDPGCRWCGEPVSQLGTRTPRRYCRRSHRQRAYEAERLGLPMKRDRAPAASPVPVPAPREMQAALFLATAIERTSVDVDHHQEPAGGDFELAPPAPPAPPAVDPDSSGLARALAARAEAVGKGRRKGGSGLW